MFAISNFFVTLLKFTNKLIEFSNSYIIFLIYSLFIETALKVNSQLSIQISRIFCLFKFGE